MGRDLQKPCRMSAVIRVHGNTHVTGKQAKVWNRLQSIQGEGSSGIRFLPIWLLRGSPKQMIAISNLLILIYCLTRYSPTYKGVGGVDAAAFYAPYIPLVASSGEDGIRTHLPSVP